jgi:hypothetical protein
MIQKVTIHHNSSSLCWITRGWVIYMNLQYVFHAISWCEYGSDIPKLPKDALIHTELLIYCKYQPFQSHQFHGWKIHPTLPHPNPVFKLHQSHELLMLFAHLS